jgi:hypothetical protein
MYSGYKTKQSGVRQWYVLSPSLFLLDLRNESIFLNERQITQWAHLNLQII